MQQPRDHKSPSLQIHCRDMKVKWRNVPPSTLHQLLCGILRHCMNSIQAVQTLDKIIILNRFRSLQDTLDSYFHKLHSEGIGRKVKHEEVIATDQDQLWGLRNAVFYTIGKHFYLRGGREHGALKLSQLQRDSDKYVYHKMYRK